MFMHAFIIYCSLGTVVTARLDQPDTPSHNVNTGSRRQNHVTQRLTEQVMEKIWLAILWELEKLDAEIALLKKKKKKPRAPAATSDPNPGMQLDEFKMKNTGVFALHIPVDELHMYILHT